MNPSEPLTPEERELARLLGRPAASSPSARVDDAVLAAARAAAAGDTRVPAAAVPPPSSTRRTRRARGRLPTLLGIAASVVFAVGIAWQLKFDDPALTDVPPPAAEVAAPSSAPPAPASPADRAERMPSREPASSGAEPPAPVKRPAAPPAPLPAPAAKAATAAVAVDSAMAPPAVPDPPPAQAARAAPLATERNSALESVSVTGSSTAAPAAPRGKASLRSQRTEPPASAYSAAPAPAAAPPAPAPVGHAEHVDSAAIAMAVEADALLPRRHWIQRIRERRDAGDVDTARASLERYLRQYPEVRIPRDLRALLDS